MLRILCFLATIVLIVPCFATETHYLAGQALNQDSGYDGDASGLDAGGISAQSSSDWPTAAHDFRRTSASVNSTGDARCKQALSWTHNDVAGFIYSRPIIYDGILVVCYNTKLQAYDVDNGNLLWSISGLPYIGTAFRNSVTAKAGYVYFGGGNGMSFSKANVYNGAIVWSRNVLNSPFSGSTMYTTSVILNVDGTDVVFAGSSAGDFRALNAATGADFGGWSTNPQMLDGDIWATTSSNDSGILYVGTDGKNGSSYGSLYAIEAASGTILWSLHEDDLNGHLLDGDATDTITREVFQGPIAVDTDGALYVMSAFSREIEGAPSGVRYKINPTGSIEWAKPGRYNGLCGPIIDTGAVYFTSLRYWEDELSTVSALDKTTGGIIWESDAMYDARSWTEGALSHEETSPNLLYTGNYDGQFVAINTSDGSVEFLCNYKVTGYVRGAGVAIDSSHVVFTNRQGDIYVMTEQVDRPRLHILRNNDIKPVSPLSPNGTIVTFDSVFMNRGCANLTGTLTASETAPSLIVTSLHPDRIARMRGIADSLLDNDLSSIVKGAFSHQSINDSLLEADFTKSSYLLRDDNNNKAYGPPAWLNGIVVSNFALAGGDVFSVQYDINPALVSVPDTHYCYITIATNDEYYLNSTDIPVIQLGVRGAYIDLYSVHPSIATISPSLCLEIPGDFSFGVSSVMLRSESREDIPGTEIMLLDSNTMVNAIFDLSVQSVGTSWDIFVTDTLGAIGILPHALTLVSEPELTPPDIFVVLSNWHRRLKDMFYRSHAITTRNGVSLDSSLRTDHYYKAPFSHKTIFYANGDTTAPVNTIITEGTNQYDISPGGVGYYTNLLSQSGLTRSQWNGLNYYDFQTFLIYNDVTQSSIYGDGDSLIYVLECYAKTPGMGIMRMELHVNYAKGIVARRIDDINDTLQVTEDAMEIHDTSNVFIPFEKTETITMPSDTFVTTMSVTSVDVNVNMSDTVFWHNKCTSATLPDSLIIDTLAVDEYTAPRDDEVDWEQWQTGDKYRPDPVLFYHGMYGQSSVWNTIIDKLTPHYQYDPGIEYLKAGELPGDCPPIIDWADQINTDVNALLSQSPSPSEKVILVGHSMGGLAVREYATDDTRYANSYENISKVIFISTPHLGSELADSIGIPFYRDRTWMVYDPCRYAGELTVLDAALELFLQTDLWNWQGQCLYDLSANCIENTFLRNLNTYETHSESIRYYDVVDYTENLIDNPWIPGPDDYVVSVSSQIGLNLEPYQCASDGPVWRGTKTGIGHHLGKHLLKQPWVISAVLKYLDPKPRLKIESPTPQDSCGQKPCSLVVRLFDEYLPATTRLYVKMTKTVGPDTSIICTDTTYFGPDPDWNSEDRQSYRGFYKNTTCLAGLKGGKYTIEAKSVNPAGEWNTQQFKLTIDSADVAVELFGQGVARGGETKSYGIKCTNLGSTNTETVHVHLYLDSGTPYISSSPSGEITGNEVYWVIDSILAGGSESMICNVSVPLSIPAHSWISAYTYIECENDIDDNNDVDEDHEEVVQSWDPNGKSVFPPGIGSEGWIPEVQMLKYSIYFENVDTASAEAVNIVIVDTLDANLDWRTLSIGPTSHPGKCIAQYDSTAGVITWTCDSIMLPPNVNPPEGEGWVSYSIMPYYLPHGATIVNKADIRFDYNPWITAPEHGGPVILTVDEYPPVSRVYPLFSVYDTTEFVVQWTGMDDSLKMGGSGVATYSICAKRDAGPYECWLTDTQDTMALFSGELNHRYYFYSIAVDSVGNVEEKPATYDAYTLIGTYLCGDANGDGSVNVGDAVFLISYIFKGGAAPNPVCAGDANGDGMTNVGDAVYLINYVFKGGNPPVEPCCP